MQREVVVEPDTAVGREELYRRLKEARAEIAELKGQWERLLVAYDAAKARSEH